MCVWVLLSEDFRSNMLSNILHYLQIPNAISQTGGVCYRHQPILAEVNQQANKKKMKSSKGDEGIFAPV